MKIWIVVLEIFGWVWITLAALFVLACLAVTWMQSGFSAVQKLLSPFNIINYCSDSGYFRARSWCSFVVQ